MPTVTKSFSFDPERDPDIARWFEQLPEYRGAVSEAMLRAIRADIEAQRGHGPPSADTAAIMRKLDLIVALLERQSGGPEAVEPDLPEDVLRTLDHLAGLGE